MVIFEGGSSGINVSNSILLNVFVIFFLPLSTVDYIVQHHNGLSNTEKSLKLLLLVCISPYGHG